MILLTPHALDNPLEVSPEEYEKLVHIKDKGWSHCNSKEEFLAKLHYLRAGLTEGKIDEDEFYLKILKRFISVIISAAVL